MHKVPNKSPPGIYPGFLKNNRTENTMLHIQQPAASGKRKITRLTVTPPQTRNNLDTLIAQNVNLLLSRTICNPEEILVISQNPASVRSRISRHSGLSILSWLEFCRKQLLPLMESSADLRFTDSASDDELIEISENKFDSLMEEVERELDLQEYASRSGDTSLLSALKLSFPGGLLDYGSVLELLRSCCRTPLWKHVFLELPPYFGERELRLVAGFSTHIKFLHYNSTPSFDRYCFQEYFPDCAEITLKLFLRGKISHSGIRWDTMQKNISQGGSTETVFLAVKNPELPEFGDDFNLNF